MNRLQLSLLVTATVLGTMMPHVDGFSLGRLFPASRSGVRGTLISSLPSSQKASSTNALKEAVKQVPTVKPETPKPVTNSPIYYIRLPPVPYIYMPGLGYVSPNTNTFKFVRPELDFVNNGRPSSIFHYKAPTTPQKPTTTTTTTTTTPAPTTTTPNPVKPTPSKKPSSIHWLSGSWMFNGRPSNLFIFNSPNNPNHFDALHKKFSKPGYYNY